MSFENDFNGWVNDPSNAYDWGRNSGTTASGSTGPSSAYDGTYYIYVETSSGGANSAGDLSIIEYTFPNNSSGSIDFYYHQYGVDQGTLYLEGYNPSTATWENLWSSTGDQTDIWINKTITFTTQYSKLRFRNVAAGGYWGDVALDLITLNLDDVNPIVELVISETVNVNVVTESTGETTKHSKTSFETDLGDWVNDPGNVSDWVRDSGGTPSSSTGPASAHDGTYYIFIETSNNYSNSTGDTDILTLDTSDLLPSFEVSFHFHQYGADQGTLYLEGYDPNSETWITEWSSTGDQGNQWNARSVTMSDYTEIRFRNVAEGGYYGDVALDLVEVVEIKIGPHESLKSRIAVGSKVVKPGETTRVEAMWTFDTDADGFILEDGAVWNSTEGRTNPGSLYTPGLSRYTTPNLTIAEIFNIPSGVGITWYHIENYHKSDTVGKNNVEMTVDGVTEWTYQSQTLSTWTGWKRNYVSSVERPLPSLSTSDQVFQYSISPESGYDQYFDDYLFKVDYSSGESILLYQDIVISEPTTITASGTTSVTPEDHSGSVSISLNADVNVTSHGLFEIPQSGLVLQLDATTITGLSNNDPVDFWGDSSGNSNDATFISGEGRPLYHSSGINGKASVYFDGVNSVLSITHSPELSLNAQTHFLVFTADSTGPEFPHIMNKQVSDMTGGGVGNYTIYITNWSMGNGELTFYDGTDYLDSGTTDVRDKPALLASIVYDTSITSKMYIDTVEVDSVNMTTAPSTNTADVGIGASVEDGVYSGGFGHKGYIAEIITYNRALTAIERQQVEDYLTQKWQVAPVDDYSSVVTISETNNITVTSFVTKSGPAVESEPVNTIATGSTQKFGVAINSEPSSMTATGNKQSIIEVSTTEFSDVIKTGLKGILYSFGISEKIDILKTGLKGISYSIGISETSNISVTYIKEIPTYDFTGSVLISVGYNEAIQGQKSIRAPTTVSETSDVTVTGSKKHESGVNLTEPSQLSVNSEKGSQGATLLSLSENVLYGVVRGSNFDLALSNPAELGIWSYKSISTGISVSESVNLTATGSNETVVDFFGIVTISEPSHTDASGEKFTSTSVAISESESVITAGRKERSGSVSESLTTDVVGSGQKGTGIEFTVSHFVNVEVVSLNSSIVDFTGSVTISERVRILTESSKAIESGINISEGSGFLSTGVKAIESGISISEGSKIILTSGSEGKTSIIISESVATDATGQKKIIEVVEITEPTSITSTGTKEHEQGIEIETITTTTISGAKSTGSGIAISVGVQTDAEYRLPYVLLIPTITHEERKFETTAMEYPVSIIVENRSITTEVILLALSRNTVRLTAEFKDFNGELVSPESVVLRIYTWDREQIGDDIPVNPESVGVFKHEYELPDIPDQSLFFEFEGTIGGNPVIARDKISVEWV